MPSKGRFWSTSHRATFARFTGVATTIAGIDIAVLYGLHGALGVSVYLSRVVSYAAAMTAGYFLNRHYTFHDHERTRSIPAELSRFYSVFLAGGLVNYATFATVVAIGDFLRVTPNIRFWLPLFGIWLGGMAGMALNYGLSHKLVFQNR